MRKYVLAIGLFLAMALSWAQLRSVPSGAVEPLREKNSFVKPRLVTDDALVGKPVLPHALPKLGSENRIYGWMLFVDIPGFSDWGIASFDADDPQNDWTIVQSHQYSPAAAAVADGKMYAYMTSISLSITPKTFSVFDCSNWKETVLAQLPEDQRYVLSDMTYDYTTETMYGMSNKTQYSDLVVVNLRTGDLTTAFSLDSVFATLACDIYGQLYGITAGGYLCSIEKQTGKVTPIGYTGDRPAFLQSMDIDLTDGTCYWAVCSARLDENMLSPGYLAKVDLNTGKLDSIAPLAADAEVNGLWAPLPFDGGAAPAKVSDFSLSMSREGGTRTTLKFKAPTASFNGGSVGALQKIEIYRNYRLLHTITSVEAGKEYTYVDQEGLSSMDMAAYRVVAVSDKGIGLSAIKSIFVGEDAPGQAVGAKLSVDNGTEAVLEWKRPQAGLNGGWYNPDSVRYRIVRMPDNVVVASSHKDTVFRETLEEYNYYWYRILPFTHKGTGLWSESPGACVGTTVSLPFYCTFNTISEGKIWEFIDNTFPFVDRVCWTHVLSGNEGYLHYGNSTFDANDYALSAPFVLESSRYYRLRFDFRASTGSSKPESMDVFLRNAETGKDTLLADYPSFVHGDSLVRLSVPPMPDGQYRIVFHAKSAANANGIDVDNVKFDEEIDAPVAGNVSDKADDSPLAGVLVKVERISDTWFESFTDTTSDGKFRYFDSLYTASDGSFDLGYLDEGTYSLYFELFEYEILRQEVTVEARKPVALDIKLERIPLLRLSGKVTDEYGSGIEGVHVNLQGYSTFQATTSADGIYAIEGIYKVAQPYSIAFFKNRYVTRIDTVSMQEDRGKDALLRFYDAQVSDVVAGLSEGKMKVDWKKADEMEELHYDNGIVANSLGFAFDTMQGITYENAAFGSIYYQPMELRSVKFWMCSNTAAGPVTHEKVNIIIFAVDHEYGFGDLLLYQKDVPCKDDQWNEFVLPRPIDIVDGVLVLVNYPYGAIGIGMDSGKDPEYPFVEQRSALTMDWTSRNFYPLEDRNVRQNIMVRAIGVPFGDAQTPEGKSASDLDVYKIARLSQGQEENPASWTVIEEGHTSESYIDQAWSGLDMGGYRYAVYNRYGSRYTDPVLSNVVGKDMITKVTIKATTNTDPGDIEGAEISLVNTVYPEYAYSAVFSSTGQLVFDSVWKGNYSVRIAKDLFETVTDTVDFNKGNEYTKEYRIEEMIVTPYNLVIDDLPDYTQKRFRWNVDKSINEDVEGIRDFTVNPSGNYGWTYLDADGAATTNIALGQDPVYWDNVFEPHAFICMNIDATEPPLSSVRSLVHSGSKALMDICNEDDPPVAKNDWIFSPELSFESEFVFSFWASSTARDYIENIRIGYSTTTTDTLAFTFVTDVIDVPAVWTKYTYRFPAEAKYVTIHVSSASGFLFILDDIYIGPDPEIGQVDESRATGYEVYLDGQMVGTTEELSYGFSGLADGEHKAGVVAVYQTGKSPMKEISFTVDPSIVDNEEASSIQDLSIYPNPVKDDLYVRGRYDRAEILDLSGKKLMESPEKAVLDMKDLRQGVYFVRFVRGEASCVKKIVKL